MADAALTATDTAQPDEPATTPDAAYELPDDLPGLETRKEWFEDWEEKTRESNKLARRDRDYTDNKQWTDEEIAKLAERNQSPSVNNRIAKKVNYVHGEEIRKRINPAARPRTPQHEDGARSMTDALRFVADEQRFDQVRSAVFYNILVEGYGGAVKRYNGEAGRHELEHVQWDRLGYDPHSRALDFGDAKYKILVLWMDEDDAVAAFPDAADKISAAISKGEPGDDSHTEDTPRRWVDRRRRRIKIVEMYFRHGADWFVSFFTCSDDLEPIRRTDILDEEGKRSLCPLEMASCYVDQEGMRYGIVRQLISLQDEINHRSSKTIWHLSVRQVIAERGVVDQPQKFMQELAKPDGFAEVVEGALDGKRIQINSSSDLAASHVQLAQKAAADLDSVGPSTSQLPGAPATSGREVIARSQAASQELGSVFDSLRTWSMAIFRLDWLCIRAHWTEEKWLRVTDDETDDGYRFVALNRPMTRAQRLLELLEKQPAPKLDKALDIAAGIYAPVIRAAVQLQHQQMAMQAKASGQQLPEGPQAEEHMKAMILAHPYMQEQVVANQVDQMVVDIVLDESPDASTLAQEELQILTDIAPSIIQAKPQIAEKIGRLIIRASQLPSKRELLAEWDKGPDPQQAQQAQMMQQIQQQLAQIQIALTQAQVQKTQADAQLSQAKAQSELAGIGQARQAQVPEQPRPPSPLEMARAERESVNTRLDVEKTRAQVEKDRAAAARAMADAASKARQATEPEVIAMEIPQ